MCDEDDEFTVICPVCGEMIDADATVCPYCNENIEQHANDNTTQTLVSKENIPEEPREAANNEKATSTFDTAIQTIEKANMLLATQVDAQNAEIYNDSMEISYLETGIKLRQQNNEEMVQKIDSNNEMIEKLSQFASVG